MIGLLKILEGAGMAVTSSRTVDGFDVVDFAPEAEAQPEGPCPHGHVGYCGFCASAAAPKCKHGNHGACGFCLAEEAR